MSIKIKNSTIIDDSRNIVNAGIITAQEVVIENDLQVDNNLNVSGNITVGGTTAIIYSEELRIADKDIVLGFTTDTFGNDVSKDTTASGGGVAIASTEGSPLVCLQCAGINTFPGTYKQLIWFKSGSFSGLNTDAWLSNYAIGIGSTQVPNGVRLAVGGVQLTDNDIIQIGNINSSGIVTAVQFVGTASTALFATNAGIATYATSAGIATYAPLSGIATSTIGGIVDVSDAIISGVSTLGFFTDEQLVSQSATLAPNTTYYTIHKNITVGSGATLSIGAGSTIILDRFNNLDDVKVDSLISVGVITATSFNSTSDIKLKTDIHQIENPIEKVLQINGVSFNWVENNQPSMGVIADDLEKVLPELVSSTNPKTVNYNGLIGLLIETVKDQQTQIDSLTERLSKLE